MIERPRCSFEWSNVLLHKALQDQDCISDSLNNEVGQLLLSTWNKNCWHGIMGKGCGDHTRPDWRLHGHELHGILSL